MTVSKRLRLGRRAVLGGAIGAAALASTRGWAARDSRVVEARLVAQPTVLELAGERVELQTYNGGFPGPVLRARPGDLLRVELVNELDEPTNLHFHGLHVSPEGNADNPFVTVMPGERFVYELPLREGIGGTFWYHPHMHHRLARQLWRGLAGPLLVQRSEDGLLAEADEQVVVIKDLTIEDGRPAPHTNADWARGKSGRLVFANGLIQPVLSAARSPVWLRLLNACNGRSLLLAREDGTPLTVVALDGHLLEAPWSVPEILVTPAQRVELLLPLAAGETVALVHRPYNRGARREPSQVERLLSVAAVREMARGPLPERLAVLERLDPAAVTRRRSFQMAMAFLHADDNTAQVHMPLLVRAGDLECWEIVNVDTQDHVFHLHTWPFQLWRRNGVPEEPPLWRDTVNLRPAERVELLIPFRDIEGKSLFHCHIAEHGDAGMMAIVEVSPEARPSDRTRPRRERADLDRAWPPGALPGPICGPGGPGAVPG